MARPHKAPKVVPIAPKPEVSIVKTEDPGTIILNLDVGRFVGSRKHGAALEVNPSELPAIAAAFSAVNPRRKLDPNGEFTEGHATREAWAQGYPLRESGTARLGVTIRTHGIRDKDGQVSARITIDQSEWGNAEGEIELLVSDIPVLMATLRKAFLIAEATGVFDPFTPWVDPEHVRPVQ